MLAAEFMDLISKSDYPDYYKIIKKPISFNMIYVRCLLHPSLAARPGG